MITAQQILEGALPRTSKVFDIEGIGEVKLYRLPLKKEIEAQRAILPESTTTPAALEKIILHACYFMLTGKFDNKKASKLLDVMDQDQMSRVFSTGLFFTALDVDSLEQTEKNSPSDQS